MTATWTDWHVWALLSAPFCALYALSAAVRGAVSEHAVAPPPWIFPVGCVGAAVISAAVATAPTDQDALIALIFLSGLFYLAIYDLRLMSVPVAPLIVLIALGLTLAFWANGPAALAAHGLAAVFGWAGFRLLSLVYARVRGRAGLGEGDALIAAMIGAFIAADGLAWSVALGGALTLIWVIGAGQAPDRPFPLAPGLAAGSVLALTGAHLW